MSEGPVVPSVESVPKSEASIDSPKSEDSGIHEYRFEVKMTCSGCSNAVTRVLEKAKPEGVSWYNVDLESQIVLVKGTIPYDNVLAKISKTGKKVVSGKEIV